MIQSFSDFLKKAGIPNFLIIGIVIIVIWLMISGLRRGLRKRKTDEHDSDDEERGQDT